MRIILLIMIGLSLVQAEFLREDINVTAGVVLDTKTSLMWQDEVDKALHWESAIGYCESLEYGGYSDWRLPNFNELYALADRSIYNPALSPVFQNVVSSGYWSSTTVASVTSYAWCVYFHNGYDGWRGKTRTRYVRCVR